MLFERRLNAAAGASQVGERVQYSPAPSYFQVGHSGSADSCGPGDSFLDATEYIIRRNTLGSTTILGADGNDNGAIDQGDYRVWRAHFGQAADSGSGAIANPSSQANDRGAADVYGGWLLSPPVPSCVECPNKSSTDTTGHQSHGF